MRSLAARGLAGLFGMAVAAGAGACRGTLDAGSNTGSGDASVDAAEPDGGLPVDASNPVILSNDGPFDNWQGEHAALLVTTGLELTGLVVNDSSAWPDLQSNLDGWQAMLDAAGASGIGGLPEPTPSTGPPLERPQSGEIDDSVPNDSEGARLIVETALDLDRAAPPLVVVTGGRLTDVADAYLIEPEIADRVVVVASLGTLSADGAIMGVPNGEMDPWANTIVVERMRYVQVSAFYDQIDDVPDSRLSELPDNPFGDWIASKRSRILDLAVASDQVAVLAVGLPDFASRVERVVQNGTVSLGLGDSPSLAIDSDGSDWLVTAVDGDRASRTFWELLDEVF